MRRIIGAIAAVAMIVAAASGATTPPSKKKATTATRALPGKKPMTALQKSVAKKRAVTGTASRNATGHSAAAGKKAPVKPAVTWRNRQLQPSQDRFKEIQTALATKGYLQPEQATGAWDQNSSDALKQFQAAQNLDTSGKINSLSLIALGLGPKHDAAPVQAAAPPAEPNR
jgi:Putative peptidoglycan binding domain